MKTEFKCVIVSDTHGDDRDIFRVIEKEKPFDTLIHCGDVEGNLDLILGPRTFGYFSVRGNCDFLSGEENDRCADFGFWKVFVTHGHRYHVGSDTCGLVRAGQEQGAHVILFGHTHIPVVREDERTGILLVNPGSLSRPRQVPPHKTYAVLTLSADKRPEAEIKKLEF